jgi:hypothetical protein
MYASHRTESSLSPILATPGEYHSSKTKLPCPARCGLMHTLRHCCSDSERQVLVPLTIAGNLTYVGDHPLINTKSGLRAYRCSCPLSDQSDILKAAVRAFQDA